jgi:hypothetical protein
MRVWLGRFNLNYASPSDRRFGALAASPSRFDAARVPPYALGDANCAIAD